MSTTIIVSMLILAGVLYLLYTRKKADSPIVIAIITVINLFILGVLGFHEKLEIKEILADKPLMISKILLILSLIYAWTMMKKNWRFLSWIVLIFPLAFFLLPEAAEGEKSMALKYVQITGIGVVLPLIIHFLSIFISNFAPPRETAFQTHKQLISLLISLVLVGFSVLMSNFILGRMSIYFLAMGIFVSALMFRGYNLNGQKHFPSLVLMLLTLFIFNKFYDSYSTEISMGQYQMITGLIFGITALFVSALCSTWASESEGLFSKILLIKSVAAPIVFLGISGLLFFVYEAFGGRLSLSASLLGAAIALPFLNQIFENRAYGGLSIVIGSALLLAPHLEHDKQAVEIQIQEDKIEYNLKKLSFTNNTGELIETNLNDLSQYQGKWILDSTVSIIEFQVVGSESITDGFFKNFTGALVIEEDYSKTFMDIEIPIAAISTFNKTRDKNIRSDNTFFDESKFPKMRYEVKEVSLQDTSYISKGSFTMRDISLPVETIFVLSGAGTVNGKEAIIIEGKGSLNRIKFGQMTDLSIGDEITFTFKAIFTKK